jgi:ribosome-associated heat shock protein Hsp15
LFSLLFIPIYRLIRAKTYDKLHLFVQVVDFLHKRMAAATAVNFYQDFSDPIQPKQQKSESVFYFNTGKRISKVGRPTKKSRREMDDFVNDSNN